MKITSAILVICVSAVASTNLCTQNTFPRYNVRGTAFQLKELWLMPFKGAWDIRIPSLQICNNSIPIAVSVTVCDEDAGFEPSLYIFNLQAASIRRNSYPLRKDAVVYVTVFCESYNTDKSSQDEKNYEPVKISPIARHSLRNRSPLIRKDDVGNKRYLFASHKPFKGSRGGTDHQLYKSSLDVTPQNLEGGPRVETDHAPNESYLDRTHHNPFKKSLYNLPSYLNPIRPYYPVGGSLFGTLKIPISPIWPPLSGYKSSQPNLPNKSFLGETPFKKINSSIVDLINKSNQGVKGFTLMEDNLGKKYIKPILLDESFYNFTKFYTPLKGSAIEIPNKSNMNGIPYKQSKSFASFPNKIYPNGMPYKQFNSVSVVPNKGYLNGRPYNRFQAIAALPNTIYLDEKHYKPSAGPLVGSYRQPDKEFGVDTFYKPVNGFNSNPAKILLASPKEGVSDDYLNGYKPLPRVN